MQPPSAPRKSKTLVAHGHRRTDEWYWLNERENPEVIQYLESENAFTQESMSHLAGFEQELFDEIRGRIKEDDSTVPYAYGNYWYYLRYEEGGEYPFYCRKEGTLEAKEQIMLDVPSMAKGEEYYEVGGSSISPDHQILAYAVDTVGRRNYTIRFKDLRSGEILGDAITLTTGGCVWAADGQHVFFTRRDSQTLRSCQVWRHRLGDEPEAATLVFQEDDETYHVGVGKSSDRKFLMIGCSHTMRDEVRVLEADKPLGEFRLFLPREGEHEYSVDHRGEHFYILTNLDAQDYRLMRCPESDTSLAAWEEIVAHRPGVLLEGFEAFQDHMVVIERVEGLVRMRLCNWEGQEQSIIAFDDAAYEAWPGGNVEFDSQVLRYHYSSMSTPATVYDHDMRTGERTLKKRQPVLGDFDPERYQVERVMVPARDGATVPTSLVYRKDLRQEGGNPLLLYGYGSYGVNIDPGFRSTRLSLLDRGFIYAIAHIRGSSTLGRGWYEAGKKHSKMNTFHDFIDVAGHLQEHGYCRPDTTYAMGGSAGGLLMGAIMNMAPEKFYGIISHVPFVDVVTTMLDDSIPLTTGEYDEWGDPNERSYYETMLSYSPYDNLEAKAYPHLLMVTGFHDSQVQYWEPAKYVAKLRTLKTDDSKLLLKTNLHAGHGGASGRFEALREVALDFAFLLDLAGKVGPAA